MSLGVRSLGVRSLGLKSRHRWGVSDKGLPKLLLGHQNHPEPQQLPKVCPRDTIRDPRREDLLLTTSPPTQPASLSPRTHRCRAPGSRETGLALIPEGEALVPTIDSAGGE